LLIGKNMSATSISGKPRRAPEAGRNGLCVRQIHRGV
jgi:hypothetical protein